MEPKIGYIPIGQFDTRKPRVCETPRHDGQGIVAYAVVALEVDGYQGVLVQMVCEDCWRCFDADMGSPDWNLATRKK